MHLHWHLHWRWLHMQWGRVQPLCPRWVKQHRANFSFRWTHSHAKTSLKPTCDDGISVRRRQASHSVFALAACSMAWKIVQMETTKVIKKEARLFITLLSSSFRCRIVSNVPQAGQLRPKRNVPTELKRPLCMCLQRGIFWHRIAMFKHRMIESLSNVVYMDIKRSLFSTCPAYVTSKFSLLVYINGRAVSDSIGSRGLIVLSRRLFS